MAFRQQCEDHEWALQQEEAKELQAQESAEEDSDEDDSQPQTPCKEDSSPELVNLTGETIYTNTPDDPIVID